MADSTVGAMPSTFTAEVSGAVKVRRASPVTSDIVPPLRLTVSPETVIPSMSSSPS